MSRILGKPIHHCHVYPDFDAALARFATGGIGPIYRMRVDADCWRYRGKVEPLSMWVGFFHSGDICFEIITPIGEQRSAYSEFLERNPTGGLHHIAYHSTDFAATLAKMEAAGMPLRVVQEILDPETGVVFEIYCETVGVDNSVLYQLQLPGLFDDWFESMHREAQVWDGAELFRDITPPSQPAAVEA